MEEVEAAARALGAHGFISALPQGYDTDVANRGGRLSAGQRQLVAFARAFLADPAVRPRRGDVVPGQPVRAPRAARPAHGARRPDVVIIAHRLSTVEIADRVLVMEHGRIVEDGTPADLIASDGGRSSTPTAPGSTRWPEALACPVRRPFCRPGSAFSCSRRPGRD